MGAFVGKRVALVGLAVVLGALVLYFVWGRSGGPVVGTLSTVPPEILGDHRVGDFVVSLEEGAGGPALAVAHRGDPGRVLWRSVPGESFVSAARGRETVRNRQAHFLVEDEIEERLPDQSVESAERRGGALVLAGRLAGGGEEVPYTLSFVPASDGRLRFVAEVEEPYNRVYLTYASSPEERFFGFGEQFTYFDLKGRKVPIFIQEQGIGRGAQPVTLGVNLRAGSGGTWYSSYALAPHYISSELRSLFLENYGYSAFDLRDENRVQVEVFAPRMEGQILAGESPAGLIEEYTEYAGRMRPLPGWVLSGAVVGLQGGTEKVGGIYGRLKARDTPVAALWLQDWVGQRQTSFGTRLWWNWELDRDQYPGWERFVTDLDRDGVRMMSYVSPWLADPSGKESFQRNLFEEAERNGYLVQNRQGEPYMLGQTDFSAALVDLSNPEARGWIKAVIKDNLIGSGASGWMADFGEGLPYDAVLHSGASAETYHNRYPEEWAQVNREAIEEAGLGDEAVFFTRSGFTRSPSYSTLFWLGDQLVSWDRHDGIKTAVVGLLSSGLSGYAFNHSDIGGYTALNSPIRDYHRSKELLWRWSELSAFTVVYRSHEGNRPGENHQIYSDEESMEHFSRLAKVYAAWEPYRRELVLEAAETGLPVVRHSFIHYPQDPEVYDLQYQFMVGPEFMVAPVLDAGTEWVEVYLPAGRWVHLWSGEVYGSEEGIHTIIKAPVGEPAVFYKEGSEAGTEFREELERQDLVE
ncbi:MAG TPA: alpha-glucosidase [Rubrobacteraceae bacterium]|nr:alpha-glucosidase [Rubrobacteraceae bacterium]